MKRLSVVILALVVSALPLVAAEDWRGDNRLSGSVVDAKSGAAVKGAKVSLRIQKGGMGGPDLTTDDKGKWAVLGLGPGNWNVDVEAPGYELKKLSMALAEGQRVPPMKIELTAAAPPPPEAAAEPSAAPPQEVKIGGVAVTPDIADAVDAGNKALADKNFKEAVSQYEKAYPTLSSNLPLKQALARAYYGSGDVKKALVLLDELYKSDPANVQNAMLYANVLLEDGQLDAGRGVIEKLPAGTLSDPTAIINIGILMLNKKQPAAARDYFTKAIAIDANRAETYYYRGLALMQLNKAAEAKADLKKTIELAPDSPEAKDAREMLKSMQ